MKNIDFLDAPFPSRGPAFHDPPEARSFGLFGKPKTIPIWRRRNTIKNYV